MALVFTLRAKNIPYLLTVILIFKGYRFIPKVNFMVFGILHEAVLGRYIERL